MQNRTERYLDEREDGGVFAYELYSFLHGGSLCQDHETYRFFFALSQPENFSRSSLIFWIT